MNQDFNNNQNNFNTLNNDPQYNESTVRNKSKYNNLPDLDNEKPIVRTGGYIVFTNTMLIVLSAFIFIVLYVAEIVKISDFEVEESASGWGIILLPFLIGIVGCVVLPDLLCHIFFTKYIKNKRNKWLVFTIISAIIGGLIFGCGMAGYAMESYLLMALIAIYLMFKVAIILYSIFLIIKSRDIIGG